MVAAIEPNSCLLAFNHSALTSDAAVTNADPIRSHVWVSLQRLRFPGTVNQIRPATASRDNESLVGGSHMEFDGFDEDER